MKTKLNRIKVLFVLLVAMLIVECIFFVPYDNIEIFRSEQNVPHSEIIGSGYATIFDIADDHALVYGSNWTAAGKRVSTSRLTINIAVTLILFIAVYFLFFGESKKSSTPEMISEIERLRLKNQELVAKNDALKSAINNSKILQAIENDIPNKPALDLNACLFADTETVDKILDSYTSSLEEYLKHEMLAEYYRLRHLDTTRY